MARQTDYCLATTCRALGEGRVFASRLTRLAMMTLFYVRVVSMRCTSCVVHIYNSDTPDNPSTKGTLRMSDALITNQQNRDSGIIDESVGLAHASGLDASNRRRVAVDMSPEESALLTSVQQRLGLSYRRETIISCLFLMSALLESGSLDDESE